MPAFGQKMSWYADASSINVPDEDIWHYLVKRDTAEEGGEEEKKDSVLEKIKHSPKLLQKELEKDAKILSEKTHIPTWYIC